MLKIIFNNIYNNIYNEIYNINIENKKEENQINENYILNKEQSKVIYNISYLSLLVTILKGLTQPFVALQTFIIHLTSLNYWQNPLISSNYRKIDIGFTSLIGITNLTYTFLNKNNKKYLLFQIIGIICYLISYYYYYQKKFWISTYLHCSLHLFSNIAMYYLFY